MKYIYWLSCLIHNYSKALYVLGLLIDHKYDITLSVQLTAAMHGTCIIIM